MYNKLFGAVYMILITTFVALTITSAGGGTSGAKDQVESKAKTSKQAQGNDVSHPKRIHLAKMQLHALLLLIPFFGVQEVD